MDVRRLPYLVELHRHGTMRAVAERLGTSTSTVSAQVSALAAEVGTPLVEPVGRLVRLTPAGRRLAEQAVGILAAVWLVALAGIVLSVFTTHIPRWVGTGLYLGMGWVVILALPALIAALPWPAIALLAAGGVFYSIGAVIYARKRPDPFPRVLGFHEVFHLFVVAGGLAFALVVWIWVLPFPRG